MLRIPGLVLSDLIAQKRMHRVDGARVLRVDPRRHLEADLRSGT